MKATLLMKCCISSIIYGKNPFQITLWPPEEPLEKSHAEKNDVNCSW